MKLKCSILVIILVCTVCVGGSFAGGYVIGKKKTTTIINHITNTSQSISQSVSVSGVIELTSKDNHATIVLDIDGITNLKASSVSNGLTNKEQMRINIK
jgi:hypothetical protein